MRARLRGLQPVLEHGLQAILQREQRGNAIPSPLTRGEEQSSTPARMCAPPLNVTETLLSYK
jgi:hypothetical protein